MQRTFAMVSSIKGGSSGRFRPARFALAALMLGSTGSTAEAADYGSVDGFDVRWDNTLFYTAGVRFTPRSSTVVSSPNADDGDRNFVPGLVSNRLDLLSVLSVSKNDFGVQASVEAWYDTVYHARTANDSPDTYNAVSVPNTEFPRSVRNLEGQFIDLTDTFLFGTFEVDNTSFTVRAGRQTLLWGESLFYDGNSIAAAQAPVDYVKEIVGTNTYTNDVYLPVGQLSVIAQPAPDLSLSAYYQFEWRASRLPGVDSYFSTSDLLGTGAERLLMSEYRFLIHVPDASPANAQFGVSVHKLVNDIDLGLYALDYDAKDPALAIGNLSSRSGQAGVFNSTYAKNIALFGASFSSYVGDTNFMGELSVRHNAPLQSFNSATNYGAQFVKLANTKGYAKADTLHAQIANVTTLAPAPLWDSADLHAELAATYVLAAEDGYFAQRAHQNAFTAGLRMIFEPRYFEVLPNLDLTVPIGLGFGELSQYNQNYVNAQTQGDFEAGVAASFSSGWKAGVNVILFLGGAEHQPLADRNLFTFSLERSF